jgi:hypothetical protein
VYTSGIATKENHMAYDPNNYQHRTVLAQELGAMLVHAGFVKLEGRGEEVWSRAMRFNGAEILVYSSIIDGQVRGDGEDAIRVCAVYRRRDGEARGLFKAMRVNRTGTTEKIVERTLQRMREAFTNVRDRYKPTMMCHDCGAWLFTSKGGKLVCAETCWAKK